MRTPITLALLSLLATAAAAGPKTADGVTATLSLVSPDELEIAYTLPPRCESINFLNNGVRDHIAREMRRDWIAADACGQVDARQVRRTRAACSRVSFRVPASTRQFDRVYPWAFPIGGGLYSHTSAFAVDTTCGPVSWQFVAPNGTVVVDGVPSSSPAVRAPQTARIGYAPVIFFSEPLPGGERSQRHTDPRLAPATARFVTDTADAAFRLYAAQLPGLDPAPGFIAAAVSDDGTTWRGDAANHSTIRLMLPATLSAEIRPAIRQFVAHELAHMLQPLEWNDAWDKQQPMLAEGGADLIAWLASASLGWADRAALRQGAAKAINSCVIAAEGKSWSGIGDRGWGKIPYDCGFTFHVLGLASRSTRAPAAAVMRDYYLAAQKGGPTDFARALECGAASGCSAQWLGRIAGDEPIASVLSAYAKSGAFLTTQADWDPALVEPVMRNIIARLMQADCHGQISIYREPGLARIGPVTRCKTLREGMVIVEAQARPLFASRAGIEAVLDACRTTGKTRLGLRDGARIDLDCNARDIAPPAELFDVDIDLLLRLLGIQTPAAAAATQANQAGLQ